MFKPCVRHLECFERDKKHDMRDKKRSQGDISSLCPSVTNLIKAQVYVIRVKYFPNITAAILQ